MAYASDGRHVALSLKPCGESERPGVERPDRGRKIPFDVGIRDMSHRVSRHRKMFSAGLFGQAKLT